MTAPVAVLASACRTWSQQELPPLCFSLSPEGCQQGQRQRRQRCMKSCPAHLCPLCHVKCGRWQRGAGDGTFESTPGCAPRGGRHCQVARCHQGGNQAAFVGPVALATTTRALVERSEDCGNPCAGPRLLARTTGKLGDATAGDRGGVRAHGKRPRRFRFREGNRGGAVPFAPRGIKGPRPAFPISSTQSVHFVARRTLVTTYLQCHHFPPIFPRNEKSRLCWEPNQRLGIVTPYGI
jgi:hypothetical protein